MENLPVDYFVKTGQFTKTTNRDVYPSIEPTAASNSQAGKVIVITGASKGIGRLHVELLALEAGYLQLQTYVALENPNVIAIALHPGIVITGMTTGAFEPFAKCTPELVEGLGVWLSTGKAAFLNGRYVSSNWSVDDLVARKEKWFLGEALACFERRV
ncbi:Short chain dehydrogenase [Lachnellula willkommii]|uniref:Short chain dehydrogenase n=1 Tax=Lachnellula willkommii TaxID=215461 RepID=A0A559MF71_9HELO|nr:Short chain dehydrogenase [Lachnellula willkommii]